MVQASRRLVQDSRRLVRVGGSESISPTAHYTSYVWSRNGLSHPALVTRQGQAMFEALRPAMTVSCALGGPTLEAYLLARHRAIDALLREAIESEGVTQVIELACGLSPRGWRFMSDYGDELTYIEADLPAMAERKRRALVRIGSLCERHRVEVVDVLRAQGPGSLAQLTESLDRRAGLAIVTEGLLGYLQRELVESAWSRFADQLAAFGVGRYLTDVQLGSEASLHVHVFRAVLGAFVRGRVHLHHYAERSDAEAALRRAGFRHATVERAVEILRRGGEPRPGARLAHVVKASA